VTRAGVILAGGQGTRIGGGKPLRYLAGRPLLAHVVERMAPQLDLLALNGAAEAFGDWGLPVIEDPIPRAGPLAGILAGMEWLRGLDPEAARILTVPVDTPFLPFDLLARLSLARDSAGAEIAIATSGGIRHPVAGLWPVTLAEALRAALMGEGLRKVERFLARHRVVLVDFSMLPVDPFFNVNTAEDLAEAERLLPLSRR
jgi:molybdopterin-guanine dinucleotide biosynthesis protein A